MNNINFTCVLRYTCLVIVFISVFSCSFLKTGYGQNRWILNNARYDEDLFHFGFVLGVNQSMVTLRPVSELGSLAFDSTYLPDLLPMPDSAKILTIESSATPGFVISIVSDMRLTNNLNLRFIPSLSFGDRDLYYKIVTFSNGDSTIVNKSKKVPSTYVSFPLEIKFRANRYNNFRPYIMGGAQYTLDLASQAKKREQRSGAEKIVKFNASDFYVEAGVGFDFYNEWFKFCLELKMMYGLTDVLKREHNIYTDGISSLKSKIFQVSFTFE